MTPNYLKKKFSSRSAKKNLDKVKHYSNPKNNSTERSSVVVSENDLIKTKTLDIIQNKEGVSPVCFIIKVSSKNELWYIYLISGSTHKSLNTK